jgi:hypothetical protein
MSNPKFKPGQVVAFGYRNRMAPEGLYEIVKVLPSESGEPRYRVRSLHEAHERVMSEYELRAVRKE